jgi:hypothetical protein
MKARLLILGLLAVACAAPAPSTFKPAPDLPGCGQVPATPMPNLPSSACATPLRPTERLTVTPPPSPTGAAAQELPAPVDELAPGRYTKSTFLPAVTFEVGDGWTAQQSAPGFFDIEDDPGSLDVVAVQFANVVGPETADAAAAEIAALDDLSVTEAVPIAIDGITGLRVVVETTDPADTDPPVFRQVMTVPAGPLSIGSGRRLEVTLLDMHGSVLAILVGGSIAEWERALERSRPVLDSVTIAY